MKTIELTQGQVAMVDDEDFDELNRHKWHAVKWGNIFYATRIVVEPKIKTNILMHRLICDFPKNMDVDHVDGDGLNNCKTNLRITTHRQNMQNIHTKGSSIYPGVVWQKTRGKWQAQIRINGKCKYLGQFGIEVDAYNAYLKALEDIGEICVSKIQHQ